MAPKTTPLDKLFRRGARLLLLLLLTLPLGNLAWGQARNVEFTPEKITDRESLREALRELKAGDEVYRADPPRYGIALPFYLRAQQRNPDNAALNSKIGDCYLHSATKALALPYLQRALALAAPAGPRDHYLLARALHLSAKWAEAIKEYELAGPVGGSRQADEGELTVTAADLARRVQECRNGQTMEQHPVRVFVDNLGPAINSPEADYSPVVSADETTLLFTSRRPGPGTPPKDATGDGYYEDIFQAEQVDDVWGKATNLGPAVNAPARHDATVGLAPDGQRLLVYVDENGGDLRESTLRGTAWGPPQRLGGRINSRYHESSASYSPDGRVLYFVSDRPPADGPGAQGGRDIYKIEIDGTSPAQNLGPTINTPYGEEAVFVLPDGKTMYFSSEGHDTMGGYDIFKSTFEDGKWSKPENLGWPINTPDDDVFFVTSASGRHGYYSSERPGGLGGKDIYLVTFLGPEKPPVLSEESQLLASRLAPLNETLLAPPIGLATARVTILKGVVTDAVSKQPLEATIDLVDNKSGETIATFRANAASGRYLVSLPSGINYGIVVRQDGYLFHSENFDLPAAATYAEVIKDIALKKLEVGAVIVLNNIFFDTGKANLRSESTAELERLRKLLATTPTLKLEMAGHTDNVGKPAFNRDLSQRRAQAVVSYLTQHGVSAGRLSAAGFGETRPVAPNTKRSGRQLNRRTEFKVTGK